MRRDLRKKFIISENKEYIIMGLVVLGIVTNLLFGGDSGKTYILSNGTKSDAPEMDLFCASFINQILNKKLQSEMVEADIFEILVQDDYKILNLTGEEAPLFTRVKEDNCAVILKDKLGLRRIDLWVNKSFTNPFYYRVRKIDEPSVEG